MKLVFIIGSGAVGKMTVGQALMQKTGFRLFHNHMMIEPVLEIFGYFHGEAVTRLRNVIFEEFAKSEEEGLIFTYLWAFDQPWDREYLLSVARLFEEHGAEVYCVELIAPLEVRLERNATENRRQQKASKREVDFSRSLLFAEEQHRLVSNPGEIPFSSYLRLENADLSPEDAADRMIQAFGW